MATVTAPARKRRSRYRGIDQLSTTDRIVVTLMIVLPTLLVVGLVWFPAIASVLLSFTNWDGIGGLGSAKIIGL
jgi:multiple sugar transport system permease protein